MNQSIIFTDLVEWLPVERQVRFIAQQNGVNIGCLVGLPLLTKLSGTQADETNAMQLFEDVRFDLEDKAESLIEDEAFDEEGQIRL
ncbi:DUF1488 family protein [Shewanella sedimentimangrovi]|uniref:DUF1488 domain-containing protein n=1 Tax=Shewanella sedimentimangrovi TaxID=2814293 RepID=A0ABX7R0K9_9GAMM|nr:DUF1488 domain-containing protein [Shewanella sedimentimangrovi]QSX37321.1 DUF1488 domain-containing protein [Shewanella sedimentimangrovi]